MADEPDAPRPAKIHRFKIGANVIAQVALVLFLATVVNYFGFQHYRRWDFSRDKKYALSDKTTRFLKSIKGRMRVTLFFGPGNPIAPDVQNLLAQYQYTAQGTMDVEQVDPERNLSRAKEVFDKYKVVSDESLLIIDYEGRHKTVKASEMAEIDPGNPMLGEQGKITAFKGEQAITSAMIDLVEGKKNAVGYILGHKEPPITAGGPMSILKQLTENENIQLQDLNLFEVQAIPPEINTVFINAPAYDFSDREMQLLRDFWQKRGRILFVIDPSAETPKLSAFLAELGIRINNDRLMANVRTGIQEMARVRDVVGRFLPNTPVTSRLADARALFSGGASSMILEQERVRAANIQVQPLLQAEKGYWGEVDHLSTDDSLLQFDQGRDQGEPLTFAALVEKGASGDERVQVNSARMVAVSTAEFIRDSGLTQGQQGLDFISASLNWLLSREQMIGIAPKVTQNLMFSLDEATLSRLRWLILFLIPLVPAIVGTAVWWQRRA